MYVTFSMPPLFFLSRHLHAFGTIISYGGTYSGFRVKNPPGGCLLLCFCCVMLELGWRSGGKGRTEREEMREPSAQGLLGTNPKWR